MTARKLTSSEVDLPVAESLTYGSGETFDLSSHRRARQALDLGLLDTDSGFNVFVLGEDQSGRMTSTLAFVREQVTTRPPPDDWLYLNNFQAPGRPLPVRLPAGSGCGFLTTMAALIPKLREALTSVFGSQEYESQVKTLAERPQAEIERMTQEVRTDARGAGMSLVQTPQGPQLFPMDDEGKPVPADRLPLNHVLANQTAAHDRFWIVGLDGVTRQLAVTAFPLIATDHDFMGAVALFWEVGG